MPSGHMITTTATTRQSTLVSPWSATNPTIGPIDHARPISTCDNPALNIRPDETPATSSICIRIPPRRGPPRRAIVALTGDGFLPTEAVAGSIPPAPTKKGPASLPVLVLVTPGGKLKMVRSLPSGGRFLARVTAQGRKFLWTRNMTLTTSWSSIAYGPAGRAPFAASVAAPL
jgi:hypothetical protein